MEEHFTDPLGRMLRKLGVNRPTLCKCETNNVYDKKCNFCEGIIVRNPFSSSFRLKGILYGPEQIKTRVEELAMAIDSSYPCPDASELVLLGALTGAYVFLSDLSRAVRTPHKIAFVRASSYHGGTQTTGKVQVSHEELKSLDLEGKDILIVEDILDTGFTYHALREALRKVCPPRSIEFCAMLSKPDKLQVAQLNVKPKFIGFQMRPPKFVVGYGLDYRGYFRDLPFIAEAAEVKQ